MSVINYFDIVTKPEPTMQADLKHADLREAFKTFFIFGALIGIPFGFVVATLGSTFGLGSLSWGAIIVVPILLGVLQALSTGAAVGVQHFFARLLGGKGTYTQYCYVVSRLFWPVMFAAVIIGMASLIPLVGIIIAIIWQVYSIYLCILAISVSYRMSKLRALAAFLIPIILFIVLVVVIFGAIILSLVGSMAAITSLYT